MNSRNLFAILFVVLPFFLSCTNAQFRVIKGKDIEIKDSAHSVSIFERYEYLCGGSLISMKSVITVAHCIFDKRYKELTVLAGVADIRSIRTGRCQRQRKEHVFIGDEYNPMTLYMDIALIIVHSEFVQQVGEVTHAPLCNFELQPGMKMQVNGWGSVTLGEKAANPLLTTTKMPVIHKDKCQKHFGLLPSTIICGGCSGSTLSDADVGAGAIVRDHLCAVAHGGSNMLKVPNLFTDLSDDNVRRFIRHNMD